MIRGTTYSETGAPATDSSPDLEEDAYSPQDPWALPR